MNKTTPEPPTSTEQALNQDLHKELSIYYKLAIKQMIRAFVKKTPREVLIEVLKSEKIIQQDYSKKGDKYVERKKK